MALEEAVAATFIEVRDTVIMLIEACQRPRIYVF